MSNIHYSKTAQGREALRQRNQLNLRERQIMVMCNGLRSHEDLVGFFGPAAADVLRQLLARGLLSDSAGGAASAPASAPASVHAEHGDHAQQVQAVREQAMREQKPEVAEVISQAAVAQPDTQFGLSQIDSALGDAQELQALPPLSESELAALREEPWARDPAPTPVPAPAPVLASQSAPASQPAPKSASKSAPQPPAPKPAPAPASGAPAGAVADALSWAMKKPVRERSILEAKNFMTQALLALEKPSALQLVSAHADVRHTVDVLLYLAQGLGCICKVAGKQAAIHIALRLSQRLPEKTLPMWLDCTLDHVPSEVSMALYEQVMISPEAAKP